MPERITIAPRLRARPQVRDGSLPLYTCLEHRYASSVTLWIGVWLTRCVLAVRRVTSWRRRVHMAELGTMSAQWLSEHRGHDRG